MPTSEPVEMRELFVGCGKGGTLTTLPPPGIGGASGEIVEVEMAGGIIQYRIARHGNDPFEFHLDRSYKIFRLTDGDDVIFIAFAENKNRFVFTPGKK